MYEPGEEKLKGIPADRDRIDEVMKATRDFLGNSGTWGSHRFNAFGYVKVGTGEFGHVKIKKNRANAFEDLEPLREAYPDFEFRLLTNRQHYTIQFRTKGSKGWR